MAIPTPGPITDIYALVSGQPGNQNVQYSMNLPVPPNDNDAQIIYVIRQLEHIDGSTSLPTQVFSALMPVGPSSLPWIDRSTRAGTRSRYRVIWVDTEDQQSDPGPWSDWYAAVPYNIQTISAARNGTSVNISWVIPSWITSCAIRVSVNGGAEQVLAVTGLGISEYTDSGRAQEESVKYSVQPSQQVMTELGPQQVFSNAKAYTQVLAALSPPNAPIFSTVGSQNEPKTLIDLTIDNAIWANSSYSSNDGTPSTETQLRYKLSTDTDWTVLPSVQTNGAASIMLSIAQYMQNNPAGGANNYEWQSRWRGAHDAFGPWSASKFVKAVYTPMVYIDKPRNNALYQSSELQWSISASAAVGDMIPVGWNMELLRNDGPSAGYTRVGQWHFSSNGTNINQFTVPNFVLQDGMVYSFRVFVISPDGLTSVQESAYFTVDYPEPTVPIINEAVWTDNGTIKISVTPQPGGGSSIITEDTVRLDIYRVEADGARILIGTANVLGDYSTKYFEDMIPTITDVNNYIVVATSAIPTSVEVPLTVERVGEHICWIFLNWGPGWTNIAKLRIDPAIDITPQVDKTLVMFEGRKFPVEFRGTADYRVFSLSGRVAADNVRVDVRSEWRQWVEAARAPAPVCYRDHLGQKLFVSINDTSVGLSLDTAAQIRATLTEVDNAER